MVFRHITGEFLPGTDVFLYLSEYSSIIQDAC